MKKRTRRSKVKYPALMPEYNLKRRQPLIDMDYIDQLSEEEKDWLNSFIEGYINADFSNIKTRRIFKTKEQRRLIYRENNARNRCKIENVNINGMLNYEEYLKLIEDELCENQFPDELMETPDPTPDSGQD